MQHLMLPAHAGMILRYRNLHYSKDNVTRTRGDDPTSPVFD